MRKHLILLAAAAILPGCGQSGEETSANGAAANAAAAEKKPRPAFCFFKDRETKDWKAELDKSGNVVVIGQAYRSDPRYRATLAPPTVRGASLEVSPTIVVNDTGFASPENWWPISETVPNSQAVTRVTVKCGAKTLAELAVPRTK